jgi:dTDP-4-dehydrorhamnose 3,5-epimerase-like enzyme
MIHPLSTVKLINLNYDLAENGDLTVVEGLTHIPFSISRVFFVRGCFESIRGNHAHKACTQFLTCPYGSVEVHCSDGYEVATFILDKPQIGLLIPPSIWAQQRYLKDNSVLTVLCDRLYEKLDYIRNFEDYKKYRNAVCNI